MLNAMRPFLHDKTALVTGGTRGIGFAVALGLARAGARVLISGTNDAGVKTALTDLRREAGEEAELHGQAADVSKWDQVESLFQFADREWKSLDILVNNAGVGIFAPVADLTPEQWHQVIDVNLTGLYYCCHAALPLLRASGDAYVFNMSSLAGRNPFAGGAAYNASKFGVNGFTEAMMLDHRREGIRITTIMPGSVATDFGFVPGQNQEGADWKIQPEDIAEIILSLLRLPSRTLVSRVEVRPSRPPK